MLRWDEDKIEVNPDDVAYRNEVKAKSVYEPSGPSGRRLSPVSVA